MGCVNCKKLRPGGGQVDVPNPHALPLQYLQQQKGTPEANLGSRAGSETQQGGAESTFSPAETQGTFNTPPASVAPAEREGERELPIETYTGAEMQQQTDRHGLIYPSGLPLVGWPEERQGEAESISTAAQQESLQEWLRCAHPQQQQQREQQQRIQNQHEMVVPVRSNDFYGYRTGDRTSFSSHERQEQEQEETQLVAGKRNLSIETLACVRRGFDACVSRDARAAEIELSKAETLYAALRNDTDPASAAAAAMQRISATPGYKWSAVASSGSSTSTSTNRLEGLDIDLEKRIVNLRDTLRDMQGGYLGADARLSLFAQSPQTRVSAAATSATAAAAAAARRQRALLPVPNINANQQLSA